MQRLNERLNRSYDMVALRKTGTRWYKVKITPCKFRLIEYGRFWWRLCAKAVAWVRYREILKGGGMGVVSCAYIRWVQHLRNRAMKERRRAKREDKKLRNIIYTLWKEEEQEHY